MIRSVLISQQQLGRLGREEALVANHAGTLGLPVLCASEKMMERGKAQLDDGTLVAGTVPFVLHAMRRLGIIAPVHEPHPEELTRWLHRRVWQRDRLRDVLYDLDQGGPQLFVKPALGWKKFTGFVVEFGDDQRFFGVSKNIPVWVSEPLEFVSEWRAYVAYGKVLDVRFVDHGGDRAVAPNFDAIRQAVAQFAISGRAPAGFVIDFGVTNDGRTALIEVNDGFSFGAYDGMSAEVYWTVTAARWNELVGNRPRASYQSNTSYLRLSISSRSGSASTSIFRARSNTSGFQRESGVWFLGPAAASSCAERLAGNLPRLDVWRSRMRATGDSIGSVLQQRGTTR